MGYDYRVGQLTASVRVRGDYDTSAPGVDDYISDGFIMDSVSEGYSEGYEILAASDADRLTSVSSSVVTSPVSSLSLPSDMYKLRGIDIFIGGTVTRMTRDDPSPLLPRWDDDSQQNIGCVPNSYRLEGSKIYTRSKIPAGSTVKFTYIPEPATLTNPDQTIDGTAGLHEYIINFALIQCRDREDKETATFEKKLENARKRITRMATERDNGQGKCLEDPLTASRTFRGRYR